MSTAPFTLRHVHQLIANLSKKHARAAIAELSELAAAHGIQLRVFVLACLLQELDFKEQKSNQHSQKVALIQAELENFAEQPDFASLLCQAFEQFFASASAQALAATATASAAAAAAPATHGSTAPAALRHLCASVLRLTPPQAATLALSLCNARDEHLAHAAAALTLQSLAAYAPAPAPAPAHAPSAVTPSAAADAHAPAPAGTSAGTGTLSRSVLHAVLHALRTQERLSRDPAALAACYAALSRAHPLELSGDPAVAVAAAALASTASRSATATASTATASPPKSRGTPTRGSSSANSSSSSSSSSSAVVAPLDPSQAATALLAAAQTGTATTAASLCASLHAVTTPADVIMDIGYAVTSSPAALRDALATVGRGSRVYGLAPLAEPEVARMLVAMGNSLNLHNTVDPGALMQAPASAFGPVLDSFAAAVGRPPVFAAGRTAPPSIHSSGENWRHEVVAAVLREDAAHLDWSRVIASLDMPDATLSSPHTFTFIVRVTLACNNGVFPTNQLVIKPWANARSHLEALRHAVAMPPEVISFTYGVVEPSRLMQPVPGSANGMGNPNHAWCSVDLYAVVLRLSMQGGGEVERAAAALLEQAQAVVPELVLLGMARCKVDDGIDADPSGHDPNPLRARMYNTLLTSAFGSLLAAPVRVPPSALQDAVLLRLWDTSRALAATSLLALVRGIANRAGSEHDQLRTSVEGVARVVNLTMRLPDLVTVLLSAPAPQLAIEVAVYLSIAGGDLEARVAQEPVPAAWQGGDGSTGFKLEAWLDTCLSAGAPGGADRFAAACVAFLKRVVASQAFVLQQARARFNAPADGSAATPPVGTGPADPAAAAAAAAAQMTPDGKSAILNAAETAAQEAAAKDAVVRADVLIVIFKQLKAHASTLTPTTSAAVTAVFDIACKCYPSLSLLVNHEIEETANALFQRVYGGQMSIGDFIELMRRYKSSGDGRERDIFQCVIHNLFNEYKYFPTYPDKVLQITGVLFGKLIQHQLISSATLGIALRHVLEALKKTPNTPANIKLYRFGMYALEQFKERLPKWPQYCAHIVQIPHLRASHAEFVAQTEAALAALQRAGPGGDQTVMGPTASLVTADGGLGAVEALAAEGGTGAGSGTGGGASPDAGAAAAAGPGAPGGGGGGSGGVPPGLLPTSAAASATATSAGAATPAATPPAVAAAATPANPRAAAQMEIRGKLAALGADLTVALAAAASGQPIPPILPSAAAAAAAAKEAEERAAAAAMSGSGGSSSSESVGGAGGGAGGAGAHSGEPLSASGRPIEAPSAAVIDRLNFIINNMSDSNVEVKAAEAAALLRSEHTAWLANHLVSKRVATQPNFHPLYLAFLDRMANRELDAEVLKATLDNAKKLLANDKVKTSSSERTLLKSLGSWLGRITLARNKPILYRDMVLKDLLLEAYETGRLIAVVPFVAKVLEGAADSRVFRPRNPWTMALLGVLREMHEIPDLKINLKFELEVLAQALSLEVKDIRPSRILHTRKRPDLRGNVDFNVKAASNPEGVPGIAPRENGGAVPGAAPPPGGTPLIPGLLSLISLRSFSPVFHPNVVPVVPPGGGEPLGDDPGPDRDEPGGAKANLRNVVAVAVDKAVRELIQPVVERSITVATITSRELVTKDFALEPDAEKMGHAAHVLAADLAGSLAIITGSDPLKVLIGNQLRSLLTAHPSVITSLPVQLQQLGDAQVNAMLQGVVQENLEVACLLVEKAAMERAVRSIDEALAAAYAARRKASEAGMAYVDASNYTSAGRWPAALPEILRPRAGPGASGLSAQQLRVYDSFARGTTAVTEAGAAAAASVGGAGVAGGLGDARALAPAASAGGPAAAAAAASAPAAAVAAFTAASAAESAAAATGASPLAMGGGGAGAGSIMGANANTPVVGSALTPGQALQEYNAALERLTAGIRATAVQLAAANPAATATAITAANITSLPPEHELIAALRDIRAVGLRLQPGEQRETVCVLQAQKLFKGLLELPSPPITLLDGLAVQSYLAALTVLRDLCRQLRVMLVSYLAYIPEDRRHAAESVVLGLMRAHLLHLPDLDAFLVKGVDAGRSANGLRFAMSLVQRACVTDRIVAPADLSATVELLVQIANRHPSTAMSSAAGPAALPVPPTLPALLEAVKNAANVAAAERARAAAAATAAAAASTPLPTGSGSVPGTPVATPTAGAGAEEYPLELRQKVLYLLETWVRICNEPGSTDKHHAQYLAVLTQHGVLANDAALERFFRIVMDLCVQSACQATATPYPEDKAVPATVLAAPLTAAALLASPVPTPKSVVTYRGVDPLSKLVVVLLNATEGYSGRVQQLQKLMGIFARTLCRDADANGGGSTVELAATGAPIPDGKFDQRPYLRLFSNLLRDLPVPVPPLTRGEGGAAEAVWSEATAFNAQVLATFANVFHMLQPARVPGFAFSWLELVSHRLFLPALLNVLGQRGWPLVHRLLIDLLRFMYPYTRRAELNDGLRLLYKGVLRLFYVLAHDFPEFLADYHWTFLEVLPTTCLQLRNCVLSASPKAARMPDPGDRTTGLEALPEATVLPRVLGNPGDCLPATLRSDVETFLRGPAGAVPSIPLREQLRAALLADAEEAAVTLNRVSVRSIVGLVMTLAAHSAGRAGDREPPAILFRTVLLDMDAEGRYALFNAGVAQLRYPNAHTIFFHRLLVSIFADTPAMREPLVRALVERAMAPKPQAWGVVLTLRELLRNPACNLWAQPYVHVNAEVERLVEAVAKSALAPLATALNPPAAATAPPVAAAE